MTHHTIVSYGIQNDTYDLSRFPTQQEGGQRSLDKNKLRTTGEDGSKQKFIKQEPVWIIPGSPPSRDIVNPGGRCSVNAALQLYFHIPSITHIPELQQIQTLKSNLDRS